MSTSRAKPEVLPRSSSRSWMKDLLATEGSLARGVLARLLAFEAIAAGVIALHELGGVNLHLPAGVHETWGAVIGLVLAYRTNTAYNRYWEGRSHWGAIVNASRNAAQIANAHARVDEDERRTSLTKIGKKVLVVVSDLRRSNMHRYFNHNNKIGLSTYLSGIVDDFHQTIHHSVIENLDFIAAGPSPFNPTELIQNERFEVFIASAQQEYDFVLVDTAPVGLVSDNVPLFKKTRFGNLHHSLAVLAQRIVFGGQPNCGRI